MALAPGDNSPVVSNLPLSKTEINLLRLLSRCEEQAAGTDDEELKKDPKFHAYVAYLQEQLTSLSGEDSQQGLSSVDGEKMADYTARIGKLATKVDRKALPDIWESARGDEEEIVDVAAIASPSYPPEESPLGATLRRRANQRNGGGGGAGAGAGEKGKGRVTVDDASRLLIEKNRLLQDDLTEQMVELAGRLKANSLMMDSSIQESSKVLDDQEVIMEHNVLSTKQANARASAIYRKSFCTGCFTWLVIFLLFWAFFGMVILIRIT